jgi:hypothetical protein
MSQTAYTDTMTAAFAGMLADNGPKDVDSAVNGEASAEMPFGVCAAFDTLDNECDLPAASTDRLRGLVIASQAYDPTGTTGNIGTSGVKADHQVSLLRKGRMWVISEQDVVPGDRLFVRYASGAGGTQLGGLRKAAVADETIDATSQGVFLSTGVAGVPVLLEVDFTNKP